MFGRNVPTTFEQQLMWSHANEHLRLVKSWKKIL